MTLDERILSDATEVRDRLLELRHEQERAQADLHHAIRRLHAAGGSLREIAEELGLSHQRVHQIVGAEASGAAGGRRHGRGLGPRFTRVARAVVAAAGDEAEAVVAAVGQGGEPRRRRLPFTRAAKRALEHALQEAAQLGSRYIGSEHVLLGVLDAEGSGGRAVLESLGADPATLREATLVLLRA